MSIRNVNTAEDKVPVKYAFISLFNKENSWKLAEDLFHICPGLIIFSSGGTYKYLREHFNDKPEYNRIIEAASYTGMPETDGGLVKTLHHKFFLGVLTEKHNEKHQADLKREEAYPIDLVIVDLYPFSEVLATSGSTIEDCRGHIDVGGPSILRAAAKNWLRVMTVPEYSLEAYQNLIAQINTNRGCTDLTMRQKGFANTFKVLSAYDADIANFAAEISWQTIKEVYEIV